MCALVRLHRDRARGDDVLRRNNDFSFARIGRHDGDIDIAANGRQRVRDLHAHAIRRLDAILRLAAPPRPEGVRGFAAIRFFGQVDFKVAVVELARLERACLAVGKCEAAAFKFDDTARLTPLPGAAILAVPVILPVDADEAPVDVGRLQRAVTINGSDFEAGRVALLRGLVFERGLDTDIAFRRTVGDAHVVPHRTSARLDRRDDSAEAQRTGGLSILSRARVERDDRTARCIGCRGREVEGRLAELFVMTAEGEPLQIGERIVVRLDAGIAFHRKVCARRAIEEADIGRDRARLVRLHRNLVVGLDVERDALRHKVLDREGLSSDFADAVDFSRDAPCATRSRFRDGEGVDHGAVELLGILEAQAPGFEAVGSEHSDRASTVAEREGRRIADERRDLHRLAGAIDATLGVDKSVGGLRRRTSADVALGQVDRRAFEVEDREVAIGRVGHQHARGDIALAAHDRASEVHAAGIVRIAAGEDLVVARDELELDA